MNPDKIEVGQDTKVNQLQLQLLLQKMFVRIISSCDRLPPCVIIPLTLVKTCNLFMTKKKKRALRYLLYRLHGDVEADDPELTHLVMGNLVFLRFLVLIMSEIYLSPSSSTVPCSDSATEIWRNTK